MSVPVIITAYVMSKNWFSRQSLWLYSVSMYRPQWKSQPICDVLWSAQ